jgi:hypothetical protein
MPSPEVSPNPYAAPQAPLAHSTADPRSWFGRIVGEWKRGAWPLVFMLNLVLPGLLGFQLCSNAGRAGMILATVVLLLLTAWFVADRSLLRARLIVGGKVVAFLQVIPLFHFLIGFISLWLLAGLGRLHPLFFEDNHDFFLPLNFLPASLLTLFVGLGLLSFAFLLGIRLVSKAEEQELRSELHKSPDSNF